MTHREGEVVHGVGRRLIGRRRRSPDPDPFVDIGVEFGDGDRAVVPQVGLAV
jgi:hypothetical protein